MQCVPRQSLGTRAWERERPARIFSRAFRASLRFTRRLLVGIGLVGLIRVNARALFLVHRLFQAVGLDACLEANVTRRYGPALDAIDGIGTRRQLGERIEDDFLALDAMVRIARALGAPELQLVRYGAESLEV